MERLRLSNKSLLGLTHIMICFFFFFQSLYLKLKTAYFKDFTYLFLKKKKKKSVEFTKARAQEDRNFEN